MRSFWTRVFVPGLSLLLLLLVAACGDSTVTTPTPPGNDGRPVLTITISSSDFTPAGGSVRVGDSVAWRNTDSVPHTATAEGAFNTGSIAPGATSSAVVMTTEGTFRYICSFHPAMTGTITVTQ